MTKWLILMVGLLLSAQAQGQLFRSREVSQPTESLAKYEGTKEGLTQLLTDLLKGNKKFRSELTKAMRPSESDYLQVFTTPELRRKVMRYHKKLYHSAIFYIQPNLETQNEILLWGANAQDLQRYEGQAIYFPGGYKEMADQLNPNLTYYRCKFVESGKSTGSAYELLVYVNDHWCFFPRPWVVKIK